MSTNVATLIPKASPIVSMAARYGVEVEAFEKMLLSTVMSDQPTRDQFLACVLVANQYGLNPVTREIFFMKTKGGGIQPIVSIDGWATLCNTHPQFDGMEFVDHFDAGKLSAITCRMFRKDRSRPVEVTEYMAECKGESPAWKKTPRRLLRHRSMIQCARYAFGFAGIMEADEFEQWQSDGRKPSSAVALVLDVPDMCGPENAAESREPDETEDTSGARDMISASINIEMLNHVRTCFPDADWESIAPVFDDKLQQLQAAAA
jgi:phage recombination protein Bet